MTLDFREAQISDIQISDFRHCFSFFLFLLCFQQKVNFYRGLVQSQPFKISRLKFVIYNSFKYFETYNVILKNYYLNWVLCLFDVNKLDVPFSFQNPQFYNTGSSFSSHLSFFFAFLFFSFCIFLSFSLLCLFLAFFHKFFITLFLSFL